MARIKYTALVESIRGSIAGTTFQANKYGYTVKTKPNITRPSSAAQNQRKLSVANQSRNWASLSQTLRQKWVTFAENHPVASRLNPDANLNGFNYFQKYNNIYQQGIITGFEDDPGTDAVSIDITNIVVILDNPVTEFLIAGDLTSTGVSWQIYYYISPPVKQSQFHIPITPRFIGTTQDTSDFELDITDAYLELFGAYPEAGDNVVVKISALRVNSGQMALITPFIAEVGEL